MKDQRKADENRCKHGVDNIDCFECYPSTPQELLGSTDYSDEPNNAKILITTPQESAPGDQEIAEAKWQSFVKDKACCTEHAVKDAVLHGIRIGAEREKAKWEKKIRGES
jgi:hypothetical protein